MRTKRRLVGIADPIFSVRPCECGTPECDVIQIEIFRPIMKTSDEGVPAATAAFPKDQIQSLVKCLLTLTEEKVD